MPTWWPSTSRLPAGCGSFLAILVRPIGRHLALAGATNASPMATACADIAGTAAYLIAVFYVGATIW